MTNTSNTRQISRDCVLVLLVFVGGCGGAKVLKEPEPLQIVEPLAKAADDSIEVSLEWVVFRGGPGSWAKNVDWDEYLLTVRSLTTDPLQISEVIVVDSLGTRVTSSANRKELVKGSKRAKRRYKNEGLQVEAGASGNRLIAAGVGAGAIAATAGAGSIMTASSAALAGTAATLVMAPVLVTGGIIRGVNNRKVNSQIELRQSSLPNLVLDGAEHRLDLFFPITPSPQRIEISYVDIQGNGSWIALDTRSALNGLHLEDLSDR